MFCPKCAKNNPDGNKFCMFCGAKFEAPAAPAAQNTAPDGFSAYQRPVAAQTAVNAVAQPPMQAAVQPPVQAKPPVQPAVQTPVQAPVQTPVQAPVQSAPAQPANTDVTSTMNTLVYQVQSESRKNKFLLVVVAILLVVIAAGVGAFFALGGTDLFAEEDEKEEETTAVQETTLQQYQPTNPADYTTLPPAVEAPVTQSPVTTLPNYVAPQIPSGYVRTSTGLLMPQSGNYDGICEAYNEAINDVRAHQGEVTLHKIETIDMAAVDVPAVIESTVNNVIQGFLGTTDNTYVYNDGVDAGGGPLGERIIPWGRDACVSASDISSCSIVENSDGGYTITLYILPETTSFDGTTSIEPIHHKTIMDPLNLATIDISPLEISYAEMRYSGATVELTVDGQGRLTELHNYLPIAGSASTGMGSIKATIGIEGSMDSTYEFTYAY